MSLIEWRDEFAIGLADVDDEHRELIAHINQLHGRLVAAATTVEVSAVLGEIETEIAAHFALEEKNMTRLGYDACAVHKADHEALLDELLEISRGVEAAQGYDPAALAARLVDWFGAHFRTHDARLHGWLHGKV